MSKGLRSMYGASKPVPTPKKADSLQLATLPTAQEVLNGSASIQHSSNIVDTASATQIDTRFLARNQPLLDHNMRRVARSDLTAREKRMVVGSIS